MPPIIVNQSKPMSTLYDTTLREEELKNKVAQDWFTNYDTTRILGNIDFCVAVPNENSLFKDELESLVWGEAKAGNNHDIYHSFVQLILTIGKAKTFNEKLPPQYLAAFDCERFAFIPYHCVQDIFYQTDFNWSVTSSNYNTKEFQQLYSLVEKTLKENAFVYNYIDDEKALRRFIKQNLVIGNRKTKRHKVNKNNFTFVYQRWCDEVRGSIDINWDAVKKVGLLDADFFLADLLSKDGNYLLDSLYVLLKHDHYQFDRKIDDWGLFSSKEATFRDNMQAHTSFWNKYERPPKREYWGYIVERRDLLVPQDIRERKGSFFTPRQWVELSQDYLARVLGEDWQDEYYIWDCCAGTGNLLVGLTNPQNVWASTLDKADVDVMHERIRNGARLYDNHIFQFDFLNDSFDFLPAELQDIISDPTKRQKLVIYINPPYAEAGTGQGKSFKVGVSKTKIAEKYNKELGHAKKELFAQFFIRVYHEIPYATLAEFSTLKILQASNFADFRKIFHAELKAAFAVPAKTFDNVKGQFPIGFFIWDTLGTRSSSPAVGNAGIVTRNSYNDTIGIPNGYNIDMYDSKGNFLFVKQVAIPQQNQKSINDWIGKYKDKSQQQKIGVLMGDSPDFQNNKYVALLKESGNRHGIFIPLNQNNLLPACVYLSARHCIPATWLNDRDQFFYPNDDWQQDRQFQFDCLVYTLFHNQNRISGASGENHWLPFTEQELEITEGFRSHFMQQYIADFLKGKLTTTTDQPDLFSDTAAVNINEQMPSAQTISPQAQAVLNAGREVYKYYHQTRKQRHSGELNASLYDIKDYFKGRNEKGHLNTESKDEHFNTLMDNLRLAMQELAKHIEPKVYAYGFLK